MQSVMKIIHQVPQSTNAVKYNVSKRILQAASRPEPCNIEQPLIYGDFRPSQAFWTFNVNLLQKLCP